MSSTWVPKIDLDSVRDLVREADIEGLIALHGASADEYEPEADQLFETLEPLSRKQLTLPTVAAILESIWIKSFSLDGTASSARRPALEQLAARIIHFFG
jgi:hypothetical protein